MGVEQQGLARQRAADHGDDIAGQAAADGARARHAAAITRARALAAEAKRSQFLIRRARTASLASLSTGCGRWSPRMRSTADCARPVSNRRCAGRSRGRHQQQAFQREHRRSAAPAQSPSPPVVAHAIAPQLASVDIAALRS